MIRVDKLRRTFGSIIAVDDISFDVEKGQVLGFLGPNGAGKSTAMKMLACFLEPDSGTASICGHDIRKDPVNVRKCMGYLAENAPAYGEMTVGSFLNFICDAREIARRKTQAGPRPHRAACAQSNRCIIRASKHCRKVISGAWALHRR